MNIHVKHHSLDIGYPLMAAQAEAEGYHLYVSLTSPWAHRTLVFRQLKSLENLITVSVVHPDMYIKVWSFNHDDGSAKLLGTTGDDLDKDNFIAEKQQRC